MFSRIFTFFSCINNQYYCVMIRKNQAGEWIFTNALNRTGMFGHLIIFGHGYNVHWIFANRPPGRPCLLPNVLLREAFWIIEKHGDCSYYTKRKQGTINRKQIHFFSVQVFIFILHKITKPKLQMMGKLTPKDKDLEVGRDRFIIKFWAKSQVRVTGIISAKAFSKDGIPSLGHSIPERMTVGNTNAIPNWKKIAAN